MELRERKVVHSRVYVDRFLQEPFGIPMGMDPGRLRYCTDEEQKLALDENWPDDEENEFYEII